MKPQIYYDNKNDHIQNLGHRLSFQIPRAAKNGGNSMYNLRHEVIDFISTVPDETDNWTDTTWVQTWKFVYRRLEESIRDIKEVGDYKLDARRRELSSIASALLGARRAVYWIK